MILLLYIYNIILYIIYYYILHILLLFKEDIISQNELKFVERSSSFWSLSWRSLEIFIVESGKKYWFWIQIQVQTLGLL